MAHQREAKTGELVELLVLTSFHPPLEPPRPLVKSSRISMVN